MDTHFIMTNEKQLMNLIPKIFDSKISNFYYIFFKASVVAKKKKKIHTRKK